MEEDHARWDIKPRWENGIDGTAAVVTVVRSDGTETNGAFRWGIDRTIGECWDTDFIANRVIVAAPGED